MSPSFTPVTVLGTGPRAAALAATLGEHAPRERDRAPGTSSPLVVCVDDYDTAARILADTELASRDVVNLTSGTGPQAQDLADLVTGRGGRYLDGALMGYPEHVGNPDTVLVYSGSPELFQRREALLTRLGTATYLGPDPATAALYDLSMLGFAWATLLGYLHSAALLRTAGVSATKTAPLLNHWMSTTVTAVIADYAGQIDEGRYPGDAEWLELDAPLMDHLVDTAEARGVDSELPRLIRSLTYRGIDAGFGGNSFANLIEHLAPWSSANNARRE
ncbi:NAD(P)-dependent oxidoreductase [Nocardia sp. NPDC048505]|uniref:imine reductase family protein n=1 Tax=unclassified Nocardia TaxID=2637762 RepID=UPI0033FA0DE4